MMHPSEEDLQMWADGELESGADALEAHVAVCARCAAVVASVRSLGGGLRAWGDSMELRSVSLVEGAKSYTVMQVPGTVEGTTTAVVWIQDEPEDTEGSTQ